MKIHSSSPAPAAPARRGPWQADKEYQDSFVRSEGWLGADGAYSLPLNADRTLWVFSDTVAGKPGGPIAMTHNSLALETPDGFEFSEKQAFTPPDGRGWFWVYDGAPAQQQDHQQLFLGRFENAPGPEGFNFRFVDSWLADVKTGADVEDVEVTRYRKLSELLPGVRASEGAALHFGAAVCEDEIYKYIYGTQDFGLSKQLVVARVPRKEDLMASDHWEVFQDGAWGKSGAVSSLSDGSGKALEVANELSVFPRDGHFWMVTQVGNEVRLLRSTRPEGPFEQTATHQVREEHPGSFSYNAKGHEQEIDERGLLVSYNRNVLPFGELVAHPEQYQPQFFRVPLG
ncbi:MAG: hypothetical protein J0I12_30425 [Candidatus Eremiobacteraeota bacterium]|nr:hypothetical protein [Candidatus Eremiobacteraeota bacterium]